jgi:hypothetical protein
VAPWRCCVDLHRFVLLSFRNSVIVLHRNECKDEDVRGKVYKLVVLHCALSRTILSFWPSGLAPAREEYGAPLT